MTSSTCSTLLGSDFSHEVFYHVWGGGEVEGVGGEVDSLPDSHAKISFSQ